MTAICSPYATATDNTSEIAAIGTLLSMCLITSKMTIWWTS
jgi:hypothetical protein